MELSDVKKIISIVPKNVLIVAATKYVTAPDMLKLYNIGINNFGENRVNAFLEKYEQLKNLDIKWHFIGHLQRNKALEVINKINCLHSLESIDLAKLINENRKTPLKCYIEVNLNNEESKYGVNALDLVNFVNKVKNMKMLKIVGLMGMSKSDSTKTEKYEQFLSLKYLLAKVNEECNVEYKELSMGMSDDFEEAIRAGSTTIRLGRILWK